MKIVGEDFDVIPDVTVNTISQVYKNVEIKDSKGNVVTEGKVGTGYTITVDDKTYTVVKKGDVNGDASVSISDVIVIFNTLKGERTLEGVFEKAAKLKSDTVTIINILKPINHAHLVRMIKQGFLLHLCLLYI